MYSRHQVSGTCKYTKKETAVISDVSTLTLDNVICFTFQCQRHGAKAKRCRVDGCEKQAQGTHDGMCKRHWKVKHFPDSSTNRKKQMQPPAPEGDSVYDNILPQSIAYRPGSIKAADQDNSGAASGGGNDNATTDQSTQQHVMPLVAFLRAGATQPPGWHRQAERRSRGLFPVTPLSQQLEPWERQLVCKILKQNYGFRLSCFR